MLMAFWEVQRLTREINTLELQAIKKRNELSGYQRYASRLGGSNALGVSNIAGLPGKLIPRAAMFAQFSNQASSMSAMQNLQSMKMMGMIPFLNNPMAQSQLEMSAFARFKEQSLKALKQQEIDILAEKEKEIQLEMNSIEQRIKSKQAMLQSVKQLASQKVRDSAPKFGLG